MSCTICHHRWCWTCGSDLNNKMHGKTEFVCSALNDTVLYRKVPKVLRPLIALLVYLIVPPLALFFGLLIIAVDNLN